jgi:SchA/CurD like domain
MFRVRPDAVEATEKLLSSYAPPQPVIDDETRLVSTSVFMKDGLVIRMIEFEGEFAKVMAHLSRDPSIQAVERELDDYLVEDDRRDMSTPGGARAFFAKAMMKTVTSRVPENYGSAATR